MTPYWVLYALWTTGSVQFLRRRISANNKTLFAIAAVLTALLIGLRFNVGGDWGAYQEIYNNIYFQPLGTAFGLSDPGYAALNWLFAQANIGVWAVNLICGILFMAGVGRLASTEPNPWLAMLVAVPYFIIVVAMGYTRQAAAIGIISYGLSGASETRVLRLVGFVAVAALFHKTAILLLPIMLLPVLKRNLLIGGLGALAFIVLFSLVLSSRSDQLVSIYVQGTYDSQGAAVRIAMNVLAAVLLLLFRKRMNFTPYLEKYWTYNALLAVLSVIALVTFSASAGVDRLSLFLIPLQMVTLSRLPYVFSGPRGPSGAVLLAVMGYSFAVQFVWLNYATNAGSWLPYRFVFQADSF